MKLADLPQFTISDMQLVNGVWVLDGEFNHLTTVREGRSWLYVSRQDSLIGDLEALVPERRQARFHTIDSTPSPGWGRGTSFPWLDGYWQAYHVSIILDPDHRWQRVTFAARDGLQSHIPGWRQLREATGAVPESNETLVPGGWDHEHCMLCNDHIDPGDAAYTDPDGEWLCVACYTSYAEPHDLSFVGSDA